LIGEIVAEAAGLLFEIVGEAVCQFLGLATLFVLTGGRYPSRPITPSQELVCTLVGITEFFAIVGVGCWWLA